MPIIQHINKNRKTFSSLFLCGTNTHTKRDAFVGDEGLFRLWKEALTQFKTAVVEHGYTYDRFREDFINSHTFHDAADADSRNDHMVNLGRIGSLLSSRDDLVRKYCDSAMTSDDFVSCMGEYMLERPKMKSRLLNLECELSEHALSVLTDAANAVAVQQKPVPHCGSTGRQ